MLFSLSKVVMSKSKKIRISQKKIAYDTYILIFGLKIYQFIPEAGKNEFLEDIDNLYKEMTNIKHC